MQDAIIMYENGKAIGGEGHPTDADDITFDNTGTDLVSENVEDAIVEVNAKTSGLTRMTKLWENPSPTASFSAQTVTLSSDDYDYLLCLFRYSGTYNYVKSVVVKKGEGIWLDFIQSGTAKKVSVRSMDYVSDTSYACSGASVDGSGDNSVCIPLAVYGIKII